MIFNKADFYCQLWHFPASCPKATARSLSFSGRSNVGKSSLINKLCSRKKSGARVQYAGQNGYHQLHSVDDCYFVDLPGYGYAQGEQCRPRALG